MLSFRRLNKVLFRQLISALLSLGSLQSFGQGDDAVTANMLPLSRTYLTELRVRHLRTSVRWKGREYDVESGIDVLLNVVRHPQDHSPPWNPATALTGLAMLDTQLNGRACLDELANVYGTSDAAEKNSILTCFITSGDPRGLPLFARSLDSEKNVGLRLIAAIGLARWNVRRGVSELISLFERTELRHLPGPPIIGQEALQTFRSYNDHQNWGFKGEDFQKWSESRTDLNDSEKPALYSAEMASEVKKWFAVNKHRFPDWKLGDPLPGNTPTEPEDRDDK